MPRKHKFTPSTFAVVRLEDLDEVANLRADLIHDYQPVNSQELFAVERLAVAQQSLIRISRMEIGLYTNFLNECLLPDGQPLLLLEPELTHGREVTAQQNRNYLLSEGMSRHNRKSQDLQLFLRFQAQTERLYRRAVEDLERVLELRSVLPNEPFDDPEPPPPEFLPPPPTHDSTVDPLPPQPEPLPAPPTAEPLAVPEPQPRSRRARRSAVHRAHGKTASRPSRQRGNRCPPPIAVRRFTSPPRQSFQKLTSSISCLSSISTLRAPASRDSSCNVVPAPQLRTVP